MHYAIREICFHLELTLTLEYCHSLESSSFGGQMEKSKWYFDKEDK